jgi:hypothetical protein
MTNRELLRARLHFQGLEKPAFKTPADMVRFFGAVQAQDFFGSLWAVGQRVENATERSVEAALNDRSIIRSWPMRGTIHYAAPEDLRWMLDLLAGRAIAKAAKYQKDAGLTKKDFVKSRSIIEKELQGKVLQRSELYEVLERKGITTGNSRGLFIIGQLAHEKIICFGPRKGKQPTFVLLDEWVPKTRAKILSKDESLADLASRYFMSHGPATARDFAWWLGITTGEALRAIDMVKLKKIGDYFLSENEFKTDKKQIVRLLSPYDEFLVAYKERENMQSIFQPNIIVNGELAGTWKRSPFKIKLLKKEFESAVQKEVKRYKKFSEGD